MQICCKGILMDSLVWESENVVQQSHENRPPLVQSNHCGHFFHAAHKSTTIFDNNNYVSNTEGSVKEH